MSVSKNVEYRFDSYLQKYLTSIMHMQAIVFWMVTIFCIIFPMDLIIALNKAIRYKPWICLIHPEQEMENLEVLAWIHPRHLTNLDL